MLQHDLEEANDVWTCQSQHPTYTVKAGNLRHDLPCFGQCAAVPVQADQHDGSHISGRDLVNTFAQPDQHKEVAAFGSLSNCRLGTQAKGI